MVRKKLVELDMMRAFAIILIVLSHLHLVINIGQYQHIFDAASNYVALTGLSLFFFISGFGLHYNNGIRPFNSKELMRFYLKRLVRIYPLYIVGLVATILTIYITGAILESRDGNIYYTLLINILGLQGLLFADNVGVLYWFIGVILLYYIIYPILVYPKTLLNIIINSIIILSFFISMRILFGFIHINFFQYYITFILGIISGNIISINGNYNKRFRFMLISGPPILLILIGIKYYIFPRDHVIIPLICDAIAAPFISLVFYQGIMRYRHLLSGKIFQIFSCISFGAYPTYLFHGIVLGLLSAILKSYDINMFYSSIIIISVLPFIFFMGYYIQLYESKYIERRILSPSK